MSKRRRVLAMPARGGHGQAEVAANEGQKNAAQGSVATK